MFRIKNDLDYEDFCELFTLTRRSGKSLGDYLNTVVFSLLTLCMLGILFNSAALASWITIFALGWLAFGIYYLLSRKKNYAKRMLRYRSMDPALSAEISFEDDCWRMENNLLHRCCRYSWIKSIVHGYGFFLLKGVAGDSVIIPERCFIEGEPRNFGRFLVEKTGLTIKEYR